MRSSLAPLAMLLAACHPPQPSLFQPAPATRLPASAAQIEEVTISRTGVLCQCPFYRMTLRRSGVSTYSGEMFTPLLGTYEVEADAGDFNRIAQILLDHDFFDSTDDPLTEPSGHHITISATAGTREHSLTDRFWGRAPDLFEIGLRIQALAGRWAWRFVKAAAR